MVVQIQWNRNLQVGPFMQMFSFRLSVEVSVCDCSRKSYTQQQEKIRKDITWMIKRGIERINKGDTETLIGEKLSFIGRWSFSDSGTSQ